jgi:glucose/mannose transport system substrate-binding protein
MRSTPSSCALLLGLLCACAEGEPADLAAETGQAHAGGAVEIFSWWTSGGELDALQAVLEVHEDEVPTARVRNAAVEFAEKARDELRTRMERGLPPDTFQANIGADLFRWVLFNGHDQRSTKVESLQTLAQQSGWLEAFDETVLDAASYDGELYGVPLNVHRINTLFYRKDLFEEHGLTPPESLEELRELCEQIRDDDDIQASRDGGVSCLALGNKWDWTLSLWTFEMLLPAIAGAQYYERFWLGEEAPSDGYLEQAVDEALWFYCGGADREQCGQRSHFNLDVNDVDWDEGIGKLASGDALMAPMGDWAKGLLDAEGLRSGVDYDAMPFPGTAGTYVFTSDTFPLPKGAQNRQGAIALLETFASREGQEAFNIAKGSIPARTDVDRDAFDEVAQRTMDDFDGADHKVKALSGLMRGDVMPDLAPMLKASAETGVTQGVMSYIAANYDSIP